MKFPLKAVGFTALLASLSLCAPVTQARDTILHLPVKDVIEMGKNKGDLTDDIKFYFGNQSTPPVATVLTKGITTNKKTNGANKTDEAACAWAMLSALIQMQQAARNLGGNAVINIESYYKKVSFSSPDQYECHAGNLMSGVALKGDIVKLK